MSLETGAAVSNRESWNEGSLSWPSRSIFDLARKKDELEALERQTLAPGFWNEAERPRKSRKNTDSCRK